MAKEIKTVPEKDTGEFSQPPIKRPAPPLPRVIAPPPPKKEE